MSGTTSIDKIEGYERVLRIRSSDNKEEVSIFAKNGSGDYASTASSTYVTITSQMADSFGNLKILNKVVGVSGGIITGVFDAHLNPEKGYEDVIGTALVSYGTTEIGAALGLTTGGPLGAVIGAGLGAVGGGLFADDGWQFVKYLVETGRENISFSTGKIEGTITKEEFLIKLHNEDPNYILKVFPEYTRYHQKIEIKSFDEKDTLVGKLNYDKNTDITTFEKIDETTNEKTVYSVDTKNNNSLSAIIIKDGISYLQSGQTISHIAASTEYTTKELLQYNGLTEEQAKNLPVGYEVQIPKNVQNLQGGYGNVKVYEGHDGSLTYHIPADNDGNIKIVKLDKFGNVLQDDFSTTIIDDIIVDGNDPTTMETNSGNVSYDESEEEIREKRGREEREFLEKQEAEEKEIYWGGVINTAVGQIGNIVSANHNFSNIEKLAVNTSFSTLGSFAEYKYNGKNIGLDDAGDTALSNLQSAVLSFAISSFFAKNDNIADILGMDGTFVGDFVDFTVSAGLGYATGMYIVNDFNTAATWADMNKVGTNGLTSLQAFSVGAVGGYLGNAFANEIMGWDTKEEAMGANIGSAVGTLALSNVIAALVATGPVGWIAAVFVAFGGSAVGNFIGGIVGGLFGKKPKIPKANAKYEFDEEDESYTLIASSSKHGGNKQAMIDIGKSLANHFENMFKLPGGQLVDASMLPDIQISQRNKTVTINGKSGKFSDVNDILSHLIVDRIPFINVENGDEYILRALNRTNEKFQEEDINAYKGRGDLEELYENISLASDYSKYKNETVVLVDKNGNLLTDTTKLQEINTLFQVIQNISDETQKEKALKEFLEEYNFVSQISVNNIDYKNNKIFKKIG